VRLVVSEKIGMFDFLFMWSTVHNWRIRKEKYILSTTFTVYSREKEISS